MKPGSARLPLHSEAGYEHVLLAYIHAKELAFDPSLLTLASVAPLCVVLKVLKLTWLLRLVTDRAVGTVEQTPAPVSFSFNM